MSSWVIALVAVTFVAALAATVRSLRTEAAHIDASPRRDMAILLWLACLGLALVAERSRFRLNSRSFYICSIATIPVSVAVLLILVRILRAARNQRIRRQ